MKEPERIPLDPLTPTAKKVNTIPLGKTYPEVMDDDVYIKPTNKDLKKNENSEDRN